MNKKRIRRIEKIITDILVIMMILIGVVQIEQFSIKILKTAGDLIVINDNIQLYNEQSRKTDAWTDEVDELIEIRREKYYNSQDSIIRIYSNANAFLKFLAIPVSVGLMVIMPLFALRHVLQCVLDRKKLKTLARKLKREKKYGKITDKMLDEVINLI